MLSVLYGLRWTRFSALKACGTGPAAARGDLQGRKCAMGLGEGLAENGITLGTADAGLVHVPRYGT